MSQYKTSLAHHRLERKREQVVLSKSTGWDPLKETGWGFGDVGETITAKKFYMRQGRRRNTLAFPFWPSSLLAAPGYSQMDAVDQDCEPEKCGSRDASKQGRAEQGKGNFLSSSFLFYPVVLFCHPLDSAFSHCLILLRLCFPARKFA